MGSIESKGHCKSDGNFSEIRSRCDLVVLVKMLRSEPKTESSGAVTAAAVAADCFFGASFKSWASMVTLAPSLTQTMSTVVEEGFVLCSKIATALACGSSPGTLSCTKVPASVSTVTFTGVEGAGTAGVAGTAVDAVGVNR